MFTFFSAIFLVTLISAINGAPVPVPEEIVEVVNAKEMSFRELAEQFDGISKMDAETLRNLNLQTYFEISTDSPKYDWEEKEPKIILPTITDYEIPKQFKLPETTTSIDIHLFDPIKYDNTFDTPIYKFEDINRDNEPLFSDKARGFYSIFGLLGVPALYIILRIACRAAQPNYLGIRRITTFHIYRRMDTSNEVAGNVENPTTNETEASVKDDENQEQDLPPPYSEIVNQME